MDFELLKLQEQVRLAIEMGESHFREFKSALDGPPGAKQPREVREVCVDIARTLVAFANADGGELLVGVEDEGTVTGVPFDGERLQQLSRAHVTHIHAETPVPLTKTAIVEIDGKRVLYFATAKGSECVHITAEGRCIQRRDRESVPRDPKRIQFSRRETESLEYDRAFLDEATLGDVDRVLVGTIADIVSKGMSPEKCLQHLDLATFDGSRLRLRRAALLLFASSPSRWHPRLQVRILRINGTVLRTGPDYNVVTDEVATDNVLRLIDASWELMRPHLTETRFAGDALFRRQIIYPELACREALINAIAHRDYSVEGRGVEVRIFTDRLEFSSPGALLSTIDIDDLRAQKGVHQSRNSFVARVLREGGYMRELGEGIRRIYELMRTNDLTEPTLESSQDHFAITLRHQYVYTREQKLWLDNFSSLELTREQKTVILLGYNGHVISPKEIWDAVGIVDTDDFRRLVESLDDMGVLERVVTRDQATRQARQQRVPSKRIGRFLVRPPASAPAHRGEPAAPRQTANKPPRAGGVEELDELDALLRVDTGPSDSTPSTYVRVYVGNLPWKTTEDELRGVLEAIGPVYDVEIAVDRVSGKSRGFGFVEFESHADAARAVASSGQLALHERRLRIARADRRSR